MSFALLHFATTALLAIPVQRAASDSSWQTVPLTMDAIKQLRVIEKKIQPINQARNIDSLASTRGLVQPITANRALEGVSPDSVARLYAAMVEYQTKVFTQPEVAPAFAGAALTPAQYASIHFRLEMAWKLTEMIDAMRAQGVPESSIHFTHPGISDADVAFTMANDAAIRALYGLPAPPVVEASTGGDQATYANATVEVDPAQGDLVTQLTKLVADAWANGELPIVEISDRQICAPCIMLDKAMERQPLVTLFKGTRLIKLSPAKWGPQLPALKYCAGNGKGDFNCDMPHFFAVDAAGNGIGGGMTPNFGGMTPDDNARMLAPQFEAFLTPLRSAKQ